MPYVGRGENRWYGGAISRATGDQASYLSAVKSNGTLYGVIDVLSRTTAAVNWQLFKKSPGGKKADRIEVPETAAGPHPALMVLRRPNSFMTQQHLMKACQQYRELVGELWMVVVKLGSLPVEMWYVQPNRIRPVVDQQAFLLGYVYTSPDGEEVPLKTNDVLRVWNPDPENVYRGMGPVQALMRTLDAAKYSSEWNANFFRNNAAPGGVIEVEESMTPSEWREFQTRWAETHKGVGNAHRVAVLENGMKWIDSKFTARDMQFQEISSLGDDTILKAFTLSKFAIGQVDDVNRATANASIAAFSIWQTVPRVDEWRDMLNTYYLPMFPDGKGLEIDYENPVPDDTETENATWQAKGAAFAAFTGAGVDGKSLIKAMELPEDLEWEKPEPPAPPAGFGSDAKGGDAGGGGRSRGGRESRTPAEDHTAPLGW